MKRLDYDALNRQFALTCTSVDIGKSSQSSQSSLLHGEAADKVIMFRQRYSLIQQRLLRQQMFRKGMMTNRQHHHKQNNKEHSDGTNRYSITPIESLIGRPNKFTCYLLGLITQVEEGQYHLEDLSASIPIYSDDDSFSRVKMASDGIITEGSIVLVQGEIIDGVLHMMEVALPMSETRMDALNVIGYQSSDIFGAIGSVSQHERLLQQELECGLHKESMFVVLSDVNLDLPHVMEKLELLFGGYQYVDPLPVFVFMGNFSSTPFSYTKDAATEMMQQFDELGRLICKFPALAQDARFVFVPGPQDPGAGRILPRPPIPSLFTASLRQKVPHATFASNPCRIRFFTKELVFYRDNIVQKMRRHAIIPLRVNVTVGDDDMTDDDTEEIDLAMHYTKTIIDQAHLCPLPMANNPIYWKNDHPLRLYPIPDAVIAGDSVDQYQKRHQECEVLNPGSFPVDYSFVVYRPVCVNENNEVTSEVEFSRIDH